MIVATWRAFWADVVAVSRTADWSSPRLATHATGRVLERLRGQFRGLAERGWVTRGTIRLLHPRAVDLKATTAKLRDCVDTARFVRVDRATGRAIDKIGGAPDDQTATLVRQAGAWKVEQTVVTGKCAG